mgnify:CR=1 FL=1
MLKNDGIRRPFPVTLLAWGVLILTMFNAVRFGSAVAQWDRIVSFMERPGPIYIAVSGLIWALGWLIVFLGLWFGSRWARQITLSMAILYSIYYWIDQLIYQSEVARKNLSFSLSVTIFFLTSTAIILLLPGSRKYFQTKRVQ